MVGLEVDFGVQEQVDRQNGSRQLAYGEDELQVYHIISTTKRAIFIQVGESLTKALG